MLCLQPVLLPQISQTNRLIRFNFFPCVVVPIPPDSSSTFTPKSLDIFVHFDFVHCVAQTVCCLSQIALTNSLKVPAFK